MVTRRGLFHRLLGFGACAAIVNAAPPLPKYGRVTVDSHRAHLQVTGESLHVWVDGIDVTPHCFEADDVEGFAHVWCRDAAQHADYTAKGHLHLDGHGQHACRIRLTGQVVIAPGAPR